MGFLLCESIGNRLALLHVNRLRIDCEPFSKLQNVIYSSYGIQIARCLSQISIIFRDECNGNNFNSQFLARKTMIPQHIYNGNENVETNSKSINLPSKLIVTHSNHRTQVINTIIIINQNTRCYNFNHWFLGSKLGLFKSDLKHCFRHLFSPSPLPNASFFSPSPLLLGFEGFSL